MTPPAPIPTSVPPPTRIGDPISYRSARDAAVAMAAIVLGGLAVTIAVAWLVYRRNLIARRRYIYVQPAGPTSSARGDRVDRSTS